MARTKQSMKKSTGGKMSSKKTIPSYSGKKIPFSAGSRKSLEEPVLRRKKPRFRNDTIGYRKILKAQKGTNLMLRRLPVQRFLRNLAVAYKEDLRWQLGAVLMFQEALEAHGITQFRLMTRLAIHGGRKTVQTADHDLAVDITNKEY